MTLSKGSWGDVLTIPAIAAPMFLVSGPDLVVETCRSGIMGAFPALNQKTSEGYAAWLDQIPDRRCHGRSSQPVRRQSHRSQDQRTVSSRSRDHRSTSSADCDHVVRRCA